MALLQRLMSRFSTLPSRVALAGFFVLALPPLLLTPWVPFVDLIAFVGLNNFPPAQSAGPLHFSVFQFTYIVQHAICRFLFDLGLPRNTQVLLLYWLQAGIFFGVLQFFLRRLLPPAGTCALAIALGVLAFWDGQFLWGGPLAFSLASCVVCGMAALTLREVMEPQPAPRLLMAGLGVLGMMCHPFAFPFALVVIGLRWIFLRRERWHCVGLAVALVVFAGVIRRDSFESPSAPFNALFGFPWENVGTRLANLFRLDHAMALRLFGSVPVGLHAHFILMGGLHLAGFLAAPIALLLARDARGIRLLALHSTIVAGMYFCARDNDVISEWPQRILGFHAPLTFVAGIVLPWYLLRRGRQTLDAPADVPPRLAWIAPSVALAAMVWIQAPVLRFGNEVERNYARIRNDIVASPFTNAFVVTSDVVEIEPFYLRCLPFLLFSDPAIVRRNLIFFTEWHMQLRHPTRLVEHWFDLGRPRYQASFTSRDGAVGLHIAIPPKDATPASVGNGVPFSRLATRHTDLAAELLGLGATRDAVAHFHSAAALTPNSASAKNNLAVALLRAGRPAEAQVQAEAALQLEPRFAPALANLGLIHTALGDLTKALLTFEQALAIDPRVPQWHIDFGVTLERLGRPYDAQRCYENALRLEPSNPTARAQLEQLARR